MLEEDNNNDKVKGLIVLNSWVLVNNIGCWCYKKQANLMAGMQKSAIKWYSIDTRLSCSYKEGFQLVCSSDNQRSQNQCKKL